MVLDARSETWQEYLFLTTDFSDMWICSVRTNMS